MTEKEAIEQLEDIKNPFARSVLEAEIGDEYALEVKEDSENALKALDIAIKALEEIQQYRAIGTVEECRSAVEKQKAKKPNFEYMLGNWEARYRCPICNKVILHDCRDMGCSFCDKCGQKLDRSEEE